MEPVFPAKVSKGDAKEIWTRGCKTNANALLTNESLEKDEHAKKVDLTLYQGISLIYITTSRPDIISVICLCACF